MTFDLDAARAKRREEAGEPFRYSVGGEEHSIPSQKEWPIEIGDLLASGKVKEGFVLLCGDDLPKGLSLGDVMDVMEAAAEFYGMGNLPNS